MATGCAALAATLLPGAATPATAGDAVYIAWSTVLPGWTDEFVPTSDNDCVAGRPQCLKHTLKELDRIFTETTQSCSHNAVFALAYMRITQTYGWSRDIPGLLRGRALRQPPGRGVRPLLHRRLRQLENGDRAAVPKAWLLAFDAGQDRRVNGTGDLLLGMNAHINRDLPFVLASVGLVAPDGTSRKPDYDKVEDFLARSTQAMMAEAAQRLDPSLDDAADPLGLAYTTIFQFISGAREAAWRHAEALVSAPTPEARALVAAEIEEFSATAARGIIASQSYLPPLTSTRSRDNYCAVHKDDAAPWPTPSALPIPMATGSR